jgi:hypothetical protein
MKTCKHMILEINELKRDVEETMRKLERLMVIVATSKHEKQDYVDPFNHMFLSLERIEQRVRKL